MTKKRIFIAINLPEDVKKRLINYQNKWSDLDPHYINWVKKENLHITLVFIGYADDDETYKICNFVKEIARKQEPFYINLERIILGPAYDKSSAGKPPTPRMFWVEGEKSQKLADLQNDLENALSIGTGYKKEARAFRPHITLARFKYPIVKLLPEKVDASFKCQISVETIEVMQSNLHRSGPEYSILESVNLGEHE